MELLSKHDKQLQEGQDKLKESRKLNKILEIKLEDALKSLRKFQQQKNHNTTIKCRECNFTCGSEESLKDHKREEKAKAKAKASAEKYQEGEGPLADEDSKCGECSYINNNRVLLGEHKEQVHRNLVYQFCGNVSKDVDSFNTHNMVNGHSGAEVKKGSQQNYPGNMLNFKCTPCKQSFSSHVDLMDHLSEEHLTEAQRQGHGLAKYDIPSCKNGDNCRFHSQYRCMFYREKPPQVRQVRHHRQAPSNQWKTVHPRWKQGHNEQRNHKSHDNQALPPWCVYGSRCKLGRPGSWNQCLLRHEEGEDFPSLPWQNRK